MEIVAIIIASIIMLILYVLAGKFGKINSPNDFFQKNVEGLFWFLRLPFRLIFLFIEIFINLILGIIYLFLALFFSALIMLVMAFLFPLYIILDLPFYAINARHIYFPIYDTLSEKLRSLWSTESWSTESKKWVHFGMNFDDINEIL